MANGTTIILPSLHCADSRFALIFFQNCRQKVVDFLDLTHVKDIIYMNLAMGVSFALYSDTAFFTLQPMYLFGLGFSKADVAKIIAIGAAADLSSRIFMAIVSLCVQVKARYIYLAGATFTIIARFSM